MHGILFFDNCGDTRLHYLESQIELALFVFLIPAEIYHTYKHQGHLL